MPGKCAYGFGCDLDLSFEETVSKTEALLNKKGFQVYTRLNVHEIIDAPEQAEFGRYIIIGACNPEFATMIFNADPNIGLLMPCNVVVYELKSGGCRVMIKDPVHIMDIIKSPAAIATSINVKCMMEEIVEELEA